MDWLAIPLQHEDRGNVLRFLEERQVQVRVCFAGNVTRHPAYREFLQTFPNSDKIMKDGFLLGAHHGLPSDSIDTVVELLKEADRRFGKK